jgi:hypothetical protein
MNDHDDRLVKGASTGLDAEPGCKGCRASVRVSESEVRRIISEHFEGQEVALATDGEYARRLAVCQSCPDLQYGTTCRHCGCLVAVRAKLAERSCPAPVDRWSSR